MHNIIILYMEEQSLCQSISLHKDQRSHDKKECLKTSINILCKIDKVFYFKYLIENYGNNYGNNYKKTVSITMIKRQNYDIERRL